MLAIACAKGSGPLALFGERRKKVNRRILHSAALAFYFSTLTGSAAASHYLVVSPVKVSQRYMFGSNALEVRASAQVGDKLLSALELRVNRRTVNVPATALRGIEWPDLATVELRRSSEDTGTLFIFIQCACGRKDDEDARTAIFQFTDLRFIGVTVLLAEE